jgi:hypothetical protein
MDSKWPVLHSNPLLPESNLPTKEERYLQNRTVQLRAKYRKREDGSWSPTLTSEIKTRRTRSGQLTTSHLLPCYEMFYLGKRNWTVQFTGKMFPFYSLVHSDINGQLLFYVPLILTLPLTLRNTQR